MKDWSRFARSSGVLVVDGLSLAATVTAVVVAGVNRPCDSCVMDLTVVVVMERTNPEPAEAYSSERKVWSATDVGGMIKGESGGGFEVGTCCSVLNARSIVTM